MQRKNDIIKNLLLNAFLTIPSPWTAEITGQFGFDFITIDMQHGLIDYSSMLSMVQSLKASQSKILVRAPWNDPSIIMKALDAGVSGIICPMINSKADAESFVGACRYSPEGYRSYGPIRAKMVGTFSNIADTNKDILTFAMIETEDGIKNLNKIASTKGLSGLYVGPSDLSISLGFEKLADFNDKKFRSVLEKVVKAAEKYNIIPATHLIDSSQIKIATELGFGFVTPINDTILFERAVKKEFAEIKDLISDLL